MALTQHFWLYLITSNTCVHAVAHTEAPPSASGAHYHHGLKTRAL